MFNELRNTSFTVKICLLSLIFFLSVGENLENPTVINLSSFDELVNFKNKAVSIYLALMIFKFGKVS